MVPNVWQINISTRFHHPESNHSWKTSKKTFPVLGTGKQAVGLQKLNVVVTQHKPPEGKKKKKRALQHLPHPGEGGWKFQEKCWNLLKTPHSVKQKMNKERGHQSPLLQKTLRNLGEKGLGLFVFCCSVEGVNEQAWKKLQLKESLYVLNANPNLCYTLKFKKKKLQGLSNSL